MKLKKIVFLEVLFSVAVLLSVMVALDLIPSLQPSKQTTSIGLYNSESLLKGTLQLDSGGFVIIPFSYTSIDPVVLVLKIPFQACEEPGYFTLYCNYRNVASVFVNSESPPLTLNLISLSGFDWAEPLFYMYGLNDLLFESKSENGYSGNISYQVILRGTR